MVTEPDNNPAINESALLRRRLVPVAGCTRILMNLASLPGVATASMSSRQNKIHLCYDATLVNIDTVLTLLHDAGCTLRYNWFDRLRLAWYRYVDENARKNAKLSGSACCSTPTSVYLAQEKHK